MTEIYIGFTGLACSLLYRIPQMYKLYKTKSSKDISPLMINIQNVSYILYIIYGYMISDIVYIVSSAVSIFQNILILILYCTYKNNITEN
jgi:MtN3 and saliva related transmembrane protein